MNFLTTSLIAIAAAAVLPQHTVTPPATAAPAAAAPRFIPFGVGEKMEYEVKVFGASGKGVMEVTGVEQIRGRPTYAVRLNITGRALGLLKVNSSFQSWIDTLTLHSLRYTSDQDEIGKHRTRWFDIFPERSTYRQKATPDTLPEMPSVPDPLDEASFLYFIRTTPLEVGRTYTYDRYFRPDRNPVIIKVLRREKLKVPAMGIIDAIVLEPTIKTSGLFGQGGEAKIWVSDDPLRMLLRIDSKVSILGTLQLNLVKYTPPRAR